MIYYIGLFMTYVAVRMPVWLDYALLIVLCSLLLIERFRKPALFGLFGILLAAFQLHFMQSGNLPEHLAGRTFMLQGEVTGLPDYSASRQRFNFEPENNPHTPELENIARIRLSWYGDNPPLKPGQKLKLKVKLKPVHGLSNPAAFNYERWALQAGVGAVGRVLDEPEYLGRRLTLDALRSNWLSQLDAYFIPPVAASLQALLLGHGKALSDDQWQLLRDTGTVHLMVVSGLHIGLVTGFVWLLGRWLAPFLLKAGCLPGVVSWFQGLAALISSGAYVLVAGQGVAAQRAWIMAAVFILAGLLRLNISVWQRWWLAMGLVVSLQPLAIFSAGFWLSFGAVAILIGLFSNGIRSVKGTVLRSQLGIFLCMTPLLLASFAQIAWLAPLINLVAIPALSLILILSVPMIILSGSGVPYAGYLLEELLSGFWFGLEYAASHRWAVSGFSELPLLSLLLALFAGIACMLPLSLRQRGVALLVWGLALLPVQKAKPDSQEFQAWVFDVGQGLAVLVEQGERRLLFDTGPGFGEWNAFSWALEPYFRRQGITELEYLVLSHGDQDHTGGYKALNRLVKVRQLLSGVSTEQAGFSQQVQACRAGQTFTWQGVHFRMLAGSQGDNDNARSCVLEIDNGHCRLLLTGDIGIPTEHYLQMQGRLKPVTWLLASHHGSRTGSSDAFLAAVKPEWVIFSAGYLNRYGHPHPQVVKATENAGARWLNTATSGAVHLEADAQTCTSSSWRSHEAYRWQE